MLFNELTMSLERSKMSPRTLKFCPSEVLMFRNYTKNMKSLAFNVPLFYQRNPGGFAAISDADLFNEITDCLAPDLRSFLKIDDEKKQNNKNGEV